MDILVFNHDGILTANKPSKIWTKIRRRWSLPVAVGRRVFRWPVQRSYGTEAWPESLNSRKDSLVAEATWIVCGVKRQSLVGSPEDFKLYFGSRGEPWQHFEWKNDKIKFVFKSCSVENTVKGRGNLGGCYWCKGMFWFVVFLVAHIRCSNENGKRLGFEDRVH